MKCDHNKKECTHDTVTCGCSGNESMCVELVPIFNHLDDEYLKQIMDLSLTRTFKKGESIFNAGDKSDNLFIVHTGKVRVYSLDESGKEHLLYILNEGDYIGETSLFLSSAHMNYAEAISDATICTIYKDDLLELLEKHPIVAIKILEEFAKRLNVSQTLSTRMIANNTDKRLALYLLENSILRNDQQYVKLRTSRKDLANLLGMSPETISRKFKEFEELNYVKQLNTKEIIILDECALESI